MIRAFPILLCLAACAAPSGEAPSLAKRPAEAIDPRLPVGTTEPARGELTLSNEISRLEQSAREGIALFAALESQTQTAVSNAGAVNSESWVTAVELLSRAEAAREPLVAALGDLDALVTNRIERGDWVSPANREAVEASIARLAPEDARQAALLQRWTAQLQP